MGNVEVEWDRSTVLERMRELPPDLTVTVGWRAAARSLPMLTLSGDFWVEEANRKHVLAVFRAVNAARLWSATTPPTVRADAARAARAARAADDAKAGNAVAYAALASADAASSAASSSASASAAAAFAFAADACAVALYPTCVHSCGADLLLAKTTSPHDLATTPLWTDPPPEVEAAISRFSQWLRDLGEGFDYWSDWYAALCEGESVHLDSLERAVLIPQEIEAQGVAKINAYLKSLKHDVLSPLNRVRAIFIGHGAAGKTSLIRTLHGEETRRNEEATPGIEIRNWPVPETDIVADLWDFGGQVIAHATHQFFLRERCLYVLVLDARTETNANDQAEYWLEHVQAFGKSAPVMLVGNKCDVSPVNLDLGRLKEKHPNVVGFYPLSCRELARFQAEWERFQRDFRENLAQAGTHQLMLQPAHFAVLEQLRKRSGKSAFLKKGEFDKLCDRKQVATTGELNRTWLLDLLDKLGVIIHFPNIYSLEEYVLNPRWLTYGVYTIIYAQQTHDRQGDLTIDTVKEVLQGKQVRDERGHALEYPEDKCQFIVDAMVNFKICYRCRDQPDRLIIPTLLPPNRPKELEVRREGALEFDFSFQGLLPRHVVPALIVERHEEIVDQLVWQNGAFVRHIRYEAEAMVEADYHERRISLTVRGPQAGTYFALLHDTLLHILERMEGLAYTEWLKLPPPNGGAWLTKRNLKASYRQLLALEARGIPTYVSEHGEWDLEEVLRPLPREKRAAQRADADAAVTPEAAPSAAKDTRTPGTLTLLVALAFVFAVGLGLIAYLAHLDQLSVQAAATLGGVILVGLTLLVIFALTHTGKLKSSEATKLLEKTIEAIPRTGSKKGTPKPKDT